MAMRRRQRRALKSEINVVPFIDVVLVLLIVFMVAAPMMQTGQVKLPSVSHASAMATQPVQVQVIAEGEDVQYRLRAPGQPEETFRLGDLVERVVAMHDANPADSARFAVVISADREVRYESVVQVMDVLQGAGIDQVGLLVQNKASQ
ncbi:biopolymer transporter ExbD [Leeia aquatica]|uniref:Protein TolR n=1 Tax=Leeia aquatica TaxID=2725557 RepID=A0A847RZ83_9NEIS|nr:biopolymer transporter ExbD [Leeia aquatica]NLR75001.1 protein TolR [Leeia aquatica]